MANRRQSSAKRSEVSKGQPPPGTNRKPGIVWTAVIFGFALNLLLFTVVNAAVGFLVTSDLLLWVSMLGPLAAGALTALVARQRGGIHALLGGLGTVPIIALYILPGAWRTAVFAACFCTIGGSLTELVQRRMGRSL